MSPNIIKHFLIYLLVPYIILILQLLNSVSARRLLLVGIIYILFTLPIKALFTELFAEHGIIALSLLFLGFVAMPSAKYHADGVFMMLIMVFSYLFSITVAKQFATIKSINIVTFLFVSISIILAIWSVIYFYYFKSYIVTSGLSNQMEYERIATENDLEYLGYFATNNVIIQSTVFCTFPIAMVFFCFYNATKAVKLMGAILFFVGIVISILFITRTAIICGILAAVITLLIYCSQNTSKHIKNMILPIILLLFIMFAVHIYYNELTKVLLFRIKNEGANGRVEIWFEAIILMIKYPFGDSSQYMINNSSAHNFLLDFGIKYGLVSVIAFIVTMLIYLSKSISNLINRTNRISMPEYIMILMFTSNLFVLMIDNPSTPRILGLLVSMFTFCTIGKSKLVFTRR